MIKHGMTRTDKNPPGTFRKSIRIAQSWWVPSWFLVDFWSVLIGQKPIGGFWSFHVLLTVINKVNISQIILIFLRNPPGTNQNAIETQQKLTRIAQFWLIAGGFLVGFLANSCLVLVVSRFIKRDANSWCITVRIVDG